ncbi:MAG TPA: hypothetical protein VGL61_33275 [Kofleriaceae bacterium]|jgi:hypothetical protein
MRASFGLVIAVVSCGTPAPSSTTPANPIVANRPAADAAITAEPPAPAKSPPDAILAWPVAPFTKAQVAEVKACDVDKLAESRYAKSLGIDKLAGAFTPATTCDRAVLAAACASRLGDGDKSTPPACIDAYRAAITANPAFVYAGNLINDYFGKVTQVAQPPIASHALASVHVDYAWTGLGTGVSWTLDFDGLGGTPAMHATGAIKTLPTWSPELAKDVGALGHSLVNFTPIAKPVHASACTDNDPDWTLRLVFDDGSKLELVTNQSNLIGIGGPWQTTVGGVTYMQLGPELAQAVHEIVNALKLPLGEPEGMMCSGFDIAAAVLP